MFSELNVVSRHINIHSGTTANSVTLSSGSFNVCSGGITCFPTVNLGGYLSVLSGGTATEIIENGGYVNIEDGASVSFAPNTISDLYLYKTSATVHSGTETNNARVTYGGTLEIHSKGIANDTIVTHTDESGNSWETVVKVQKDNEENCYSAVSIQRKSRVVSSLFSL